MKQYSCVISSTLKKVSIEDEVRHADGRMVTISKLIEPKKKGDSGLIHYTYDGRTFVDMPCAVGATFVYQETQPFCLEKISLTYLISQEMVARDSSLYDTTERVAGIISAKLAAMGPSELGMVSSVNSSVQKVAYDMGRIEVRVQSDIVAISRTNQVVWDALTEFSNDVARSKK